MQHVVCTRDPDRWTTVADEGAKELCRACPRRWRCAQEACETPGAEGVWAGIQIPQSRSRPPVRAEAVAVDGRAQRVSNPKTVNYCLAIAMRKRSSGSMQGVWSEGPISNPNDLGPALTRAVAAVKRGEPALVDVVTQVR